MPRPLPLLVLTLLLVPLLAAPAAAETRPYCVLIINSYHPGFAWSDDEQQAIIRTLERGLPPGRFDPHAEYLDAKHMPTLPHEPELVAMLNRKYAHHRPDLIVLLDNPAVDFFRRHRADLFADIPAVFCGYSGYDPARLAGDRQLTGVVEALDPVGTMRAAVALQPELREFIILNDTTVTGLGTRSILEAARDQVPPGVSWRVLPPVPLEDLGPELAHLPPTAALLILSYTVDNRGRDYNTPEPPRLLAAMTAAPIYVVHSNRLGHGAVGGLVLDGREHGRQAAAVALRVLGGEPAGSIPVQTAAPTVPMFDDAQLRRLGIDPRRLPPRSVVINRPPTVWRDYPREAGALLTAVLALAALAAWLTITVIRRRRAEAKLRTLDALKTTLLTNVSHELRSPLVAIRGYTELLGEELAGRATAKQRGRLDLILRNLDRLLALINTLLDFSRLEAGGLHLRRSVIDLNAVVTEAAATVAPLAERAGVRLRVETGPGPVRVTADAARLGQAVANLLDNAVKFTPGGGEVVVAVAATGGGARLTVSDTGIGIQSADQKKVFERFYQVDGSINRLRGGTGLGLAIVREIVRRHGGKVGVRSDGVRGSTFTVTLPLAPPGAG